MKKRNSNNRDFSWWLLTASILLGWSIIFIVAILLLIHFPGNVL